MHALIHILTPLLLCPYYVAYSMYTFDHVHSHCNQPSSITTYENEAAKQLGCKLDCQTDRHL